MARRMLTRMFSTVCASNFPAGAGMEEAWPSDTMASMNSRVRRLTQISMRSFRLPRGRPAARFFAPGAEDDQTSSLMFSFGVNVFTFGADASFFPAMIVLHDGGDFPCDK